MTKTKKESQGTPEKICPLTGSGDCSNCKWLLVFSPENKRCKIDQIIEHLFLIQIK